MSITAVSGFQKTRNDCGGGGGGGGGWGRLQTQASKMSEIGRS